MTVSSSDIDSRDNMGQSTRLEVDEGIQFRHLNRVYFSPSTQQPRHDDDLGMDSPPQPQSRSNLQYIDIHDASFSDQEDEYMHNIDSMEDIDFGDSNQRHSMYDDQGDEFATITIRRRPDLIVEEEEGEHEAIRQHRNHQQNAYRSDDGDDDEEDDGIDLVMEGHRNFTGVIRSPSSSPLSHIERPRHAQLSPRSAAALTNIFTMDRSSWSQPMISSSITAGLIAMAQPGTQSEYDNNPYYRRPSVSFFERANNTIQTNTPTPSNSNHSSLSSHPQWQLSTDPGNAFIPRSMLTPHGSLNLTATNSYQQYERIPSADGRSCGEANCIASMEAQGDVWPLKFDMYYADGGEFNAAHSVENVLKNDSSVYCSRRSTNINICLKLSQPHLSFVLTQFRAKAPTTGFTAPCKEGLIFISHEPIQLEKTKYFDNITRQMYDEYMNAMEHQTGFDQMYKIHGSNADAIVPAAFFQLGGPDETCTINFTPNRSRCTNALQRPENIDLQYLGLFGYTGARSFASGGLL
ncbi:hypothetical protein FBU30_007328 [Linnemannia zychae]|nr:hypothetical protein FBU30_007328 [Linnemannia zychae]